MALLRELNGCNRREPAQHRLTIVKRVFEWLMG